MTLRERATRRTAVTLAAALVVAAGAGTAIAAATDVFDPQAERAAFHAAVADKLGVSTDELETAFREAALERLDAAVEAGRITEEQAKLMRARIESGDFLGPMGPMGGRGLHARGALHLTAAAEYLGLDVAALTERLRAGESLAGVAKSEGKSVAGLKQAILADAKAKLGQAVEDGTITAAHRDAMLERLETKLDDIVNRTGPAMGRAGSGPGHGRGGSGFGHGGGFGRGMGGPPDA